MNKILAPMVAVAERPSDTTKLIKIPANFLSNIMFPPNEYYGL
jgi:hypothetical protein